MIYYITPLRYPGGKNKLSRYIRALVDDNGLIDGTYIEPYAGGAAVALNLLVYERARKVIINDISLPIYAFWHSVFNDTQSLCSRIEKVDVTVDEWQKQREIYKNARNHSLLEVGLATFFLNRVNRSGILNGGIIGGKEQSGVWKMDVRFKKEDLMSRIKLIARYRDRIYLHNLDALELIDDVLPKVKGKAFIYFDPPYYTQGDSLYENYYDAEDHQKLANKIKNEVTIPWIVSYDDVKAVRDMYEDYHQEGFNLSYTAHNKYKGSEVLIFGHNLIRPDSPIFQARHKRRKVESDAADPSQVTLSII